MKTKFYWVALLASAALIGQAQGGGYHGGGGGFGGGGRAGPVGGGGGFRGGGVPGAGPAVGGGVPCGWLPRSSPGVRWCAQIPWSGSTGRRSRLRHTALLFIWSASVISAACLL